MVKLFLSSPKGNSGLRYFPCSGYLGLTPIRVDGVVRTKLDDDQKLLQAQSITISVRCYETRTRVGSNYTNVLFDHTLPLWTKPDHVEFEPIGNFEFPFRVTIPAKAPGFSNAIFVDYKCMWRIEAVLNHLPIAGVGCRQVRHFDLNLVRHDVPSLIPLPLDSDHMALLQTNKVRSPKLKYSIHSPKTAIGPMDLVSIPLHLQSLDHDVSIRTASVVVERRITLNDNPSSSWVPPEGLYSKSSDSSLQNTPSRPNGTPTSPSPGHSPSCSAHLPLPLESDLPSPPASAASTPDATLTSEPAPLLHILTNSPSPLHSPPCKVVINSIAGAESTGMFVRDQNGVFSKTLTLQWPSAKSRSLWAIGETITSDLVSVKFFLRTKIVVNGPSGTETLELPDKELFVVSTNEAERQLAMAKYQEIQEALRIAAGSSLRSKSKSPRRTNFERTADGVSPSPTVNSIPFSTTNSDAGISSQPELVRGKPSRRPHTSAGPRDKPLNFAGAAYAPPGAGNSTVTSRSRQDSGSGASTGEQSWESACTGTNNNSSSSNRRHAGSKRHSETSMKNIMNRPEYFESYAALKKNILSSRLANATSGGVGGSSRTKRTSNNNGVLPPMMKSVASANSTSSSGYSSINSLESSPPSSQSSQHIREWEEELARIEARSKESSTLFASVTQRRVPTIKYHSVHTA